MTENKNIICPKCGHICKEQDSFCYHCGCDLEEAKKIYEAEEDNIETKYCPRCGKACLAEENFCSACGYSFIERTLNENSADSENEDDNDNDDSEDTEEEEITRPQANKFTMLITGMLIFGCFVYLGMKLIGSVPDEQIKNDTLQEEDYTSSLKAKSCHDKEVKETALQIFKENDYYYKYINPSTISNTSLKFATMDSYNVDTDKYFCKATVTVTATADGFAPLKEEFGNHYFDKITEDYASSGSQKKYSKYQCEINYASQISQNQVYITATACGNGSGFDFNNVGKFTRLAPPQKPKEIEEQAPTETEQEQQQTEEPAQNTASTTEE